MTFPLPIVSPRPSAVIAYIGSNGSDSNLATYTFSGQSIGTASSDRFVMVCVHGTRNAATSISSVTIGGNAATAIVTGNDSNGFSVSGIYGLLVPSGTTADIVVVFSAACNAAGIDVFAATRLGSTSPTSAATSTAAPGSLVITCPGGGFILACSQIRQTTTYSWVNAIEASDTQQESGGANPLAHATAIQSAAGAYTITATPGTGTTRIVTLGAAMR